MSSRRAIWLSERHSFSAAFSRAARSVRDRRTKTADNFCCLGMGFTLSWCCGVTLSETLCEWMNYVPKKVTLQII